MPKGDSVEQAIESTRVLFNFRRTDSEAVRLDHRVHAPEEVEITFLVSLHEVTGKNDRFARETIHLPEPFRCGFWARSNIPWLRNHRGARAVREHLRRAILSLPSRT